MAAETVVIIMLFLDTGPGIKAGSIGGIILMTGVGSTASFI